MALVDGGVKGSSPPGDSNDLAGDNELVDAIVDGVEG
jgi:hypothetical protein